MIIGRCVSAMAMVALLASPESLIEAADGAPYAAKQGGGDRLMISGQA